MGLDDIKRDNFGEEDYIAMKKTADDLQRFDEASKPTEADSWGTWIGKLVLLALGLTVINFLAIFGYMCWQWVLNR